MYKIYTIWFMRILITSIFLTIGFLQLSLAGRAQWITLERQQANIKDLLQEITRQSGFDFVYTEELVAKTRPVDINVSRLSLKRTLEKIFADQELDFVMDGKNIILKAKNTGHSVSGLVSAFAEVRGQVLDSLGQPLAGATIRVLDAGGRRTTLQTSSDQEGFFLLRNVPQDARLEITYVGYIPQIIRPSSEVGLVILKALPSALDEVEVLVNTGYQQLPKERATGAFTHVTKEELNLRTGSTLLGRLEDIIPGLQINRISGGTQILIRGLSTFSGSGNNNALIILDQFPYEGDLDNINPDDIESITLLKDASASSIWGARAGNGVLVINTKKPYKAGHKPINVSAHGNISISPPTDLRKDPRIQSSDFIDLEIDLFNKGLYNADLVVPDQRSKVYSPVVSLLAQAKNGQISESEAYSRIDEMREYDYRSELMDHVFRNSVRQQYGMTVSGGSPISGYLVSAGFATGHNTLRESGTDNRFNLRAVNDFKIRPKLQLQTALNYTVQSDLQTDAYYNILNISPRPGLAGLYPYARFLDDNGQPLALPYRYHPDFVDTAGNGKLLDWTYRPLDISNKSWSGKLMQQHAGINVDATYELLKGWNLNLVYGHERQVSTNESHQSEHRFDMRDQINRFTQIRTGGVVRPIPLGGLYQVSHASTRSHRFRAQTNLNTIFAEKHAISALMGTEVSQKKFTTNGYKRYGYNDDTYLVASDIDYIGVYPVYGGLAGNQRLGSSYSGMRDETDRFLSFFGNASYTYDHKYILSFSARQDAANVFGIKANDRWNPLWSTGLSWNLTQEAFMEPVRWIDQLKLRLTYGHSGTSPYGAAVRPILHINASGHSLYPELPYAIINFPANPQLKWEDVQMTNFAADFSVFRGKVKGSFDYYLKHSTGIVTNYPLALTNGRNSISANVGDMKGKGFELQLNSTNHLGGIRWTKQLALSHSKNEVVRVYLLNPSAATYIGGNSGLLLPIEGKSLYPVFMFRTDGLNPENGYPIGYLGEEQSGDYSQILSATTIDQAQYHGTLLPTYYGFFRNSFSYRNLDLSFNLAFRFGHVFIRETFNGSITGWDGHSDYYRRWQKPGDENHTDVPAYVYPEVSGMMNFYRRSASVVEPGDVIRIQDLQLSYQLGQRMLRSISATNLQLFANMSDVALLWKASKNVSDPNHRIPLSPGFSFGLRANW